MTALSEAERVAGILADWVRGEPDRIARYFAVDDDAKEVIRNGVKKGRPAAIDAALRNARKLLEAQS